MKKEIRVIIWVFLLVGLVLSACSKQVDIDPAAQTAVALTLDALSQQDTSTFEPSQTATETPEPATPTATLIPTPELVASGPTNFPENINPLTGLVVSDISLLNRRPVFVKVANYPTSGRPHAGLSSADIVFEYYIGAGANRFMPIYYGQDSEKIGSVRSGRLVDPQLVTMYQGILGFMSADARVYSRITQILGDRAITGSQSTCPGICDDGRNIVTSVFADSGALTDISISRGVENSRPNLDGMRFDPEVPSGGEPGESVMVTYAYMNQGEWQYDPVVGKYLRLIEETDEQNNITMIPLVDSNTNQQLAFSNVIVLYAYYNEYSPTLHDISIWDNTYGQRALIFRDGQAFEADWRTTSWQSPIQFTDSNGSIFALKPGNTWIVIIGTYSTEQSIDGDWSFVNYLP